MTKTKHQNLINFRKQGEEPVPLNIRGDMWREWPASNHLTWAVNITSRVKKAQQRLYFLKLTCPSSCWCPSITALLKAFSPMTSWCGSLLHCVWQWSRAENHPISTENHWHTATLIYMYRSRCLRRATNIITSHPGSRLFTLLPSGWR